MRLMFTLLLAFHAAFAAPSDDLAKSPVAARVPDSMT